MTDSSAFLEAVKKGDAAAVAAALDADPSLADARTAGGVSAVLLATYYGQRAVAGVLIERGRPLDVFEAAATGQVERLAALVSADPGLVNAYAPDGHTPLGLAAFFGHPAAVDLLLAHGADPNQQARNDMRVRPLHAAVAQDDTAKAEAIAATLLRHGAEVNVHQQHGWTPLHEAAFHGHTALVRLLLAHGADPALQAENGATPLSLAMEHGRAEVIRLLERQG